MSQSESKQQVLSQLQQRPRSLGEGNELVLFANGPGSTQRIWLGVLLVGTYFLGMLHSGVDALLFLHHKEVEGIVTDSEATSMSVNDRTVYQFFFKFQVDGKDYESYAYSHRLNVYPHESVTVEYNPIRPQLARLKGSAYSALGWLGLGMCYPALILLMVASLRGLAKAFKWRGLLRKGMVSLAMLMDKIPTGAEINGKKQYKLKFAFETPNGGTHEVMVKTHHTEELLDESEELMLYHPDNPDDAVLWDQFPMAFKIGPGGIFQPPSQYRLTHAILKLVLTFGLIAWGCYLGVRVLLG